MKIYIAGKISGIEAEAEALFEQAEQMLVKGGHTPLNPMKLVDQTPGRTYEELLIDALGIMRTADGVFRLGNWHDSVGAQVESYISRSVKRPIYDQYDELPNRVRLAGASGMMYLALIAIVVVIETANLLRKNK